MRPNREDEIVKEYNLAYIHGRFYRAAQAAGSLFEQGGPKERSLARSLVQKLSPADRDSVLSEVLNSLQRAQRIVSVGEQFTYEEVILILTLRIEAQLGLTALGLASPQVNDVQSVTERLDEDLRHISADRRNRATFRQARESLRKNWQDRFPRSWLSLDFISESEPIG